MTSQHFYGSSQEDLSGPRKRERDWGNDGGPAPKRQRDESSTVFLGNLAPDVTEEQIATTFGRCGGIREIRLKRHDDTGKVKGTVIPRSKAKPVISCELVYRPCSQTNFPKALAFLSS